MFFLYYSGTRAVTKRVGWVADYCPNCGDVETFELLRSGVVKHVYSIAAGPDQLLGHSRQCSRCHVLLRAEPTAYTGCERKPSENIMDLVSQTFPRAFEIYAKDLKQAKVLRAAPHELTAESRQAALFEPFRLFNPLVERRYAKAADFDKASGSGCLLTILIVSALITYSCRVTGEASNQLFQAGLLTLLLGFVVTVVLTVFGPRRYLRSHVIPGLVLGLLPLRPTRDEVARTLKRARDLGLQIGRKVKARHLIMGMEAQVGSIKDA